MAITAANGFQIWIIAVMLCSSITLTQLGVSGAAIDIDPIAVALPNDADGKVEGDEATQQQYTLPDWLADFNDPDVGPGVPYVPSEDDKSLKILSWDLVPPQKQDPETSLRTSIAGQQRKQFPLSSGQSVAFNPSSDVTSTRPTRTTTTTTTSTTTTTPKPTTTTTTSTTTTTTPPPPPPTTTTTIAPIISDTNSVEFYELPGGNSQFLPSYLEGYNDTELSVALPFEVPADNDEYNHTLSNDLLPPLEPFEDLKTLHIPALLEKSQSAATQNIAFTSPPVIPSTTSTTTTLKPTTTRLVPSAPAPFQFRFSQPTSTTRQVNTFAAQSTTTTKSPLSNQITRFTLKSASQPTGFRANGVLTSQFPQSVQPRPTVPPVPVLKPIFNPFISSRIGQNAFTSSQITTTTSTTTTTTTETPTTESFVFDSATIPSWLSDINDPDLGPGIPFTLPGSSDPQLIYNDLVPPSEQTETPNSEAVTIQKSISSEIPLQSFLQNSISSQSASTRQPFSASTVQEPVRLFTFPTVVVPNANDNANSQSLTNSISTNDFAASTEPSTKTTSKVTFNKSDQGKVITNTVFAPLPTQQTTKTSFGSVQPSSPTGFTSATITPGAFGKPTTAETVQTGKYTGSFGGAPGVLGGQNRPGYAVLPDGRIVDPDHTVPPVTKVQSPVQSIQSRVDVPTLAPAPAPVPVPVAVPTTASVAGPKRGYTGSFGGPPGVLVPYDNANRAQ